MYEVSYFDDGELRVVREFTDIVAAVRCFRDAVWNGMYCVRLLYLEDETADREEV